MHFQARTQRCPDNHASIGGWRALLPLLLVLTLLPALASATIAGQWDDRFFLSPGCDGSILATALAPDGRLFLGGQFASCNGVVVNNLAVFDPTSQSYSAVIDQGVAGVNGTVRALVFDGNSLYVAGSFTQAGSLSANRIARLDGNGWSRLGTEQDNGVTTTTIFSVFILDMVLIGSRLYVAGSFDTAGAITANNIAYWENEQWSSVGSGAENGVDGGVNDLLALGNQIVLGGGFTQAGTIEANRVALWTGSAWASIGTGPDNGVGTSSTHSVSALASLGSDLVVGGRFDRDIAGVERSNLVRWDGTAWQAFGAEDTQFPTSDRVSALLVDGSDLYAGGSFGEIDAIEVNNLARWDGSGWHPVGALTGGGVVGNNGSGGLNDGSVFSLAKVGNSVLVGGTFSTADGIKAMGIARFLDATTLPLGPDDGLGLDGRVQAVAVFQNDIYVGGTFSYAGPTRVNRIARFDGQQWHALEDNGFIGVESSTVVGREVNALAVYQGELHVGGDFDDVAELGLQTASNLIRWTGSAWNPINTPPSSTVNALTIHEGELLVGGNFLTLFGGQTVNRIAAFDGSVWSALENFLGNGVDDAVYSLASSGEGLYLGGWFNTAGGVAAEGVALWDGTGFSSPAGGPGGDVYSLVANPNRLVVGGGAFSPDSGDFSRVLSSFSDGSWLDPADLDDGFASGLLDDPAGLVIAGRIETQAGLSLGISILDDSGQIQRLGEPVFPALALDLGGAIAVRRHQNTLLVGGAYNWLTGLPVAGFSIFTFDTQVEDAIFSDRFEGADQ
ncbi:hypothetical protein [Wenzhouxiangella marina]|uniref:Uncharacterized protein n=1 Tax=Wenzhouxiangella marina TaxID=1579979 RepID=A0A0K0XUC0_9GAMM|nr:hypothetical protein [Wenzhouxiangella marina]AKS41217.1 hypothetical protein WM2015_836 [Wenzhouxiangella marina]MBB6088097.1 hypothetical protein [Wenzhouxiangella marina]